MPKLVHGGEAASPDLGGGIHQGDAALGEEHRSRVSGVHAEVAGEQEQASSGQVRLEVLYGFRCCIPDVLACPGGHVVGLVNGLGLLPGVPHAEPLDGMQAVQELDVCEEFGQQVVHGRLGGIQPLGGTVRDERWRRLGEERLHSGSQGIGDGGQLQGSDLPLSAFDPVDHGALEANGGS